MKIGLIAMSGIRCADAELAAMGLSLPGFLDRGRAIASMPNLALITLAGMTPACHRIQYLEVPDLDEAMRDGTPLKRELEDDFDLVAISSYSAQIGQAYKLADYYRSRGIKVVMGGLHVSAMPCEAAEHADAVSIGEGEPVWLQILDDCERGALQKFYGAQFSKFSLSDAPMPAFDLLHPEKYNRLLVQTSRGCPHRCDFCASSIMISNKYKQKPANKVLAEVDAIRSIWRRPFIELADDNAFVNRPYWYELLPELKNRKVRWFAETDIAIANDDRLLKLLADSGCAEVLVGLESPTQDSMAGVERLADWKYKVWPTYRRSIRKIQSYGIRVIGCFVLGLDGHTVQTADLLYDYVTELELFDVQITIATAFPGTPMYARMVEQERLLEPTNWDKCTLFDVNFRPSAMSAEELRSSFKALAERMYTKEAARGRRHAYKQIARDGKSDRAVCA